MENGIKGEKRRVKQKRHLQFLYFIFSFKQTLHPDNTLERDNKNVNMQNERIGSDKRQTKEKKKEK